MVAGVGAARHLEAVRVAVPVAVGMLGAQLQVKGFFPVAQQVPIRVEAKRIRAVALYLGPVGETVAVRVGVVPVGFVPPHLVEVRQAVPVAVHAFLGIEARLRGGERPAGARDESHHLLQAGFFPLLEGLIDGEAGHGETHGRAKLDVSLPVRRVEVLDQEIEFFLDGLVKAAHGGGAGGRGVAVGRAAAEDGRE